MTSGVKLPKLRLQTFNGEVSAWQSFWEQFGRAIYENDSIPRSEKFQYLRNHVTGPAAAAIAGLQATEACYDDAIEILTLRFGDKGRIEQNHLAKLRALPPVASAKDTKGLRKMYDHVQTNIRGLKRLGVGSATYCTMMSDILLKALPSEVVVNYHRQQASSTAYRSTGETQNSPTSLTSPAVQEKGHSVNGPLSTRSASRPPSFADAEDELADILSFLRIEVESRERAGVVEERQETQKKRTERPRMPAASVLHANITSPCFFCRSTKHATEVCTGDLTLEVKKRRLEQENRCFTRSTSRPQRRRLVQVWLHSQYGQEECVIEVVEVPFICKDVVQVPVDHEFVRRMMKNGRRIADMLLSPLSTAEEGISLLVGSDQLWRVNGDQVLHCKENQKLVAISTIFGWTFQGPVSNHSSLKGSASSMVCVLRTECFTNEDVGDILRRFGELESIGISDQPSSNMEEQNELLNEFNRTIRKVNGRYEVGLPFRVGAGELRDNRTLALKRLEMEKILNFVTCSGTTKRYVLCASARVFDPLGLLAPFVLRIKVLFQEIWERGIGWDDDLTDDLLVQWRRWCAELPQLEEIVIPRCIVKTPREVICSLQLHVFCDASPVAYGTCAYLRAEGEDGKIALSHFTGSAGQQLSGSPLWQIEWQSSNLEGHLLHGSTAPDKKIQQI
ncbi:uncharacterized protein LOC121046418 [Ixodes scapularis]|uniref:uncharacterized protein LOC121046418 n=1 Tax=Ixodes scapularis TaxID=6945 RepID=UPI001C38427B|nr:uncharacterized protein LOC121046418 [Ixodes scapularis]